MSEFDNEVSILYKISDVLNIPLKYMLGYKTDEPVPQYISERVGNYTFESIFDVIQGLVNQGFKLIDIYNFVTGPDALTFIKARLPFEISMIYYGFVGDTDTIVNEINALFEYTQTKQSFDDIEDVTLTYKRWLEVYTQEEESDSAIIEKQRVIQEILESIQSLTVSDITYSNVALSMKPSLRTPEGKGRYVIKDDGIVIFNDSVTSNSVPYIQYNASRVEREEDLVIKKAKASGDVKGLGDGIQKYIKVYKILENRDPVRYTRDISKTKSEDTFYLNISVGSDRVKSYKPINYFLTDNNLTFSVSLSDEEDIDRILKSIEQSLPIVLGEPNETSIQGEFNLLGLNSSGILLDTKVFLHMVLNDELFYNYLYVQENATPFPIKKSLTLQYKSLSGGYIKGEFRSTSSARIKITQSVSTDNQRFEINGRIQTLKKGIPYLQISFIAKSRNIAIEMSKILNRLISKYTDPKSYDEVNSIYIDYLGEDVKEVSKVSTVKKTTNKKSKDIHSERFPGGYARFCQGNGKDAKPLFIKEDEVIRDENGDLFWKGKSFKDEITGKDKPYQVMSFPPNDPDPTFVVCPSEAFPYPGLRENKGPLKDKTPYPFLPCCYKDDHMSPNANSFYNEYYRGIPKTSTKKTRVNQHIIRTDKITETGRIGNLPIGLKEFLQSLPGKEISDFRRVGSPISPNTLLHCVCDALEIPEYIEGDNVEKEEFVEIIRTRVLTTVNPALLKSELYEYTDSQILQMLNNVDIFLDPAVFYRAVEEVFNINIFTFIKKIDKTGGESAILETSRYKGMPIKAYRKRHCVLIYKNFGTVADALEYPQCELIVDLIDLREDNKEKLFSVSTNDYLFDVYKKSYPNYTVIKDDILSRLGLYDVSTTNYIKGDIILTGQVIDNYGKCRGVSVESEINENEKFTIVFPPTQPFNLPVLKRFIRCDVEYALDIVSSQPTARSINKKGLTNGLYFSIHDVPYGVYIPINPSSTNDLSSLSVISMDSESFFVKRSLLENNSNRLNILHHILNIVLQIVLWLFIISNTTTEDFFSKYVSPPKKGRRDKRGQDSKDVYDISRVPIYYPYSDNIDVAIKSIKEYIPTLFIGDKVYLYSEKFYQGVKYFIQRYENTHTGLIRVIPETIENYYQYKENFINLPSEYLFIDINSYLQWFNIQRDRFRGEENETHVYPRISADFSLRDTPYIYKSFAGLIYLVQNVISDDYSIFRALNLSASWIERGINLGFTCPPIEKQYSYILYGLSPSGELSLLSDNRLPNIPPLEILKYNATVYAAMLTIA